MDAILNFGDREQPYQAKMNEKTYYRYVNCELLLERQKTKTKAKVSAGQS